MRVLGINDEQTVCDCCGRANLKRTVALDDGQGGPVVRYGVACAARALGKTTAKMERLAVAREHERREAAAMASRKAWCDGETTLRTGFGRTIVVRVEEGDFVARQDGAELYRSATSKTAFVQRIIAAGGAIIGGPPMPQEAP